MCFKPHILHMTADDIWGPSLKPMHKGRLKTTINQLIFRNTREGHFRTMNVIKSSTYKYKVVSQKIRFLAFFFFFFTWSVATILCNARAKRSSEKNKAAS